MPVSMPRKIRHGGARYREALDKQRAACLESKHGATTVKVKAGGRKCRQGADVADEDEDVRM